jgi:hypothetical protein
MGIIPKFMHLEADILQNRIKSKKVLDREAKEELRETKKGKVLEKAIENKKKGRPYKQVKGHNGKELI